MQAQEPEEEEVSPSADAGGGLRRLILLDLIVSQNPLASPLTCTNSFYQQFSDVARHASLEAPLLLLCLAAATRALLPLDKRDAAMPNISCVQDVHLL